MMDGMMGMMHGWGLVILLLVAILAVLIVMAFRTSNR
jgi:cbb3-type cytochrome oxidase subunit 3